MRTTLTIEEDVALQLQNLCKVRGSSLKSLVNQALREGLKQLATPRLKENLYQTRSVSLGKCLIPSVDDVGEALVYAEKEDYK